MVSDLPRLRGSRASSFPSLTISSSHQRGKVWMECVGTSVDRQDDLARSLILPCCDLSLCITAVLKALPASDTFTEFVIHQAHNEDEVRGQSESLGL